MIHLLSLCGSAKRSIRDRSDAMRAVLTDLLAIKCLWTFFQAKPSLMAKRSRAIETEYGSWTTVPKRVTQGYIIRFGRALLSSRTIDCRK